MGMSPRVQEIVASSILVRSKLPATDFVANPYVGCVYGCSYCYASFMTRQAGEPLSAWGDFVQVKVNAADLARQEISRMRPSTRASTVMLSSVTDPYQGVEGRYRLTRGILTQLLDHGWTGRVRVLTKSPLVLRDLDLLVALDDPDVGVTVTTTADGAGRHLERRAPATSARLDALAKLAEAGLDPYAFVGPLLPHFRRRSAELDELFGKLARAGVRRVLVEHLNMSGGIRRRVLPQLTDPQERDIYRGAAQEEHRAELDDLVAVLLARHGLQLRLGRVLRHDLAARPADALVDDAPPRTRSLQVVHGQRSEAGHGPRLGEPGQVHGGGVVHEHA